MLGINEHTVTMNYVTMIDKIYFFTGICWWWNGRTICVCGNTNCCRFKCLQAFVRIHSLDPPKFLKEELSHPSSFSHFLSAFFVAIGRYELFQQTTDRQMCFSLKHSNFLIKFSKLFVKHSIRFNIMLI